MSTPDEDLIRCMAKGDRASFSQLYDRHSRRVFGLLVGMLRDHQAAEDVLQDVFLEAWKRARQFDPARASVRGWLTLLARSRARDNHRRRSRAPGSTDSMDQLAKVGDFAPRLEQKERAAAAHRALDSLTEEQRSAILAAYFGGLTHEDIACQTNLPLGTVKTRIRRGMQRLRGSMTKVDGVSSK